MYESLYWPCPFFLFQFCLQGVLNDFINSLCLPVTLGVSDCAKALRNSQLLTKLSHLLAIKLFPIVRYQLVRDAIAAHNGPVHKLLELFGRDSGQRLGLCPLSEVIYRNNRIFDSSLGLREFFNQINSPHSKGPRTHKRSGMSGRNVAEVGIPLALITCPGEFKSIFF